MRSEFDFELKPRKLALTWVVLSSLLLAASLAYTGVVLWQGHAALRDARAEVARLQWQLQSRTQSSTPSRPPYAKDAHDALRLLNWPFDEALREVEHCLPDAARLTALQLDGTTQEALVTAELPRTGDGSNFDELIACLNAGRDMPAWRITQLSEVMGAAVPTAGIGRPVDGVDGMRRLVSMRRKTTP